MKILDRAVVGAFAGGVAGALIGASTMFAVDVLNPMPAHAIYYEKCEAMNKMYGRLMASMRKAADEVEVSYASENEDPAQHQKWKDATWVAMEPAQLKINKVIADYKAAGCH